MGSRPTVSPALVSRRAQSHGRRILFHDMRNGEVVCATVDVKTRQERVLAKGRMVSWGQPDSDWAPIYGVHFQPGRYKDVELLNVETGEIRTLVTGKQVRDAFPEQIRNDTISKNLLKMNFR